MASPSANVVLSLMANVSSLASVLAINSREIWSECCQCCDKVSTPGCIKKKKPVLMESGDTDFHAAPDALKQKEFLKYLQTLTKF